MGNIPKLKIDVSIRKKAYNFRLERDLLNLDMFYETHISLDDLATGDSPFSVGVFVQQL